MCCVDVRVAASPPPSVHQPLISAHHERESITLRFCNLLAMDNNNIAARLLKSSNVRIAEAAKRVFFTSSTTAMLPSMPSSSTLSAATVLRRMSDPTIILAADRARLGLPSDVMLPTTRVEETTVLSTTATAARTPTLPHPSPVAAAESSRPKVREVRSVSTATTAAAGDDEGGRSMQMQQRKTSRKRDASCSTTTPASSSSSSSAADIKHVSAKSTSAKSSSLGTSSSSKVKKKKKSKANDETNAVVVMSDMIGTTTVTKPLRPLSSFHLFSQIEREYIIQTTTSSSSTTKTNGGNTVDVDNTTTATTPTTTTTDDPNKSYLSNVPFRYRDIELSHDWYAGPGKRRKRKHRKSHGVIGFQELSRMISARWATLDVTDRETKAFVTRIAARELEGYKSEMKEYKRLLAAEEALHTTTTTVATAGSSTSSSSSNDDNVHDETCSSRGDAAAAANNDVRLLTKSSHEVTRVVSEHDEYECIKREHMKKDYI